MQFKTKIVQSETEANGNEVVYDIEKGVEALNDFIKDTFSHTKDYYKLTKKMNGKDPNSQKKLSYKFCKNNLKGKFVSRIEDSFFKNKELDYIPEEKLNVYILGVFIVGNSREEKMKANKDTIFAKVLREICEFSMNNRMVKNNNGEEK